MRKIPNYRQTSMKQISSTINSKYSEEQGSSFVLSRQATMPTKSEPIKHLQERNLNGNSYVY